MSDYATPQDVKEWLGITVDTDDVLLDRLITTASALMNTILRPNLLTASHTELRDGPGGNAISVKNCPMTAVAGVSIDGVTIPVSSSPLTAGYVFSDNQIKLRGYKFTRGVQNVVIQYTGGLAAVPADLVQACIELVAFKYRGRNWIGQNSKILQGETVSFRVEEVPKEVMAVLKQYQSVAPI
jgi:hypothetical protein